jgi:long-subunit acyl-CoA synthetase (AMP-forming)
MAGNQVQEVPFAGRWKELLIREDGEEIVPEPVGNEATKRIWTSQVMIPFSVKKNIYALPRCRKRLTRDKQNLPQLCNLWA